jgi:hypothetical protein
MPDAPIDRLANRRAFREFVERCFEYRGCVSDVGVAGATTGVALDFFAVAPAVGEMVWHQPLPQLRIERTAYF